MSGLPQPWDLEAGPKADSELLSGPWGSLPAGKLLWHLPGAWDGNQNWDKTSHTHRSAWSSRHSPPPRGHLHMAGLMGHHKGRGEAVFVVEGTASQGVAHASDRRVPCQGWGERAERGHTQVRQDATRSVLSQPLQAHLDRVTARGSREEEGFLQRPALYVCSCSMAPGPSCPCILRRDAFPPGLQLPAPVSPSSKQGRVPKPAQTQLPNCSLPASQSVSRQAPHIYAVW